jgi:arylformamidase
MTIDYEAEYNNRARVPEHPGIIEGWMRDAAAYREVSPPRILRYGEGERGIIHVFAPDQRASRATVLFIHGGYWQALHPSTFSHLARGLNERGIAVAMPAYDLCPTVPLRAIVGQMRAAARALAGEGRTRLVAAGHSAGGHLTACLLATKWRDVDSGLPDRLIRAGYAISGLFDLPPLVGTSINGALGLDGAEAEALSPLFWPAPAGTLLDAVVGGDESGEYHRQSRDIVRVWGEAGVGARFETIEGANHFTVIAPLADPASAMTARIADLAEA